MVKVRGKGNKHRLVPLSMEMKKVVCKHAARRSAPASGIPNGAVMELSRHDRSQVQPHTLRSYICCDHLRNGRNLFYLFKILGHSSVTTTRKYLPSVGVDDLQALHDTLSPLAPKGAP